MKYSLLFLGLISIAFSSCKKSKNGSSTPDAYMNMTAASTWNYQRTNAGVTTTFTLTSTSRDTVINGRTYHVYSNSTGGNQYYAISGHDYYQFDSLPSPLSAGVIERLYLKDDIAATLAWTQNVSVNFSGLTVPLTITNTISEKGISRTVNGTTYTDVIHVSTSISSSLIPAASLTSNIHSYYARRYGLVENTTNIVLNYLTLNQTVNVSTMLVSANLK